MRLVRLSLLALLAALGPFVHDADACTIVLNTEVFPALTPAPLNTHVWIRHPPWHRTGNPMYPRNPTFAVDFVLRAVAGAPTEIPVAVREWFPGNLVELVPEAPLPPNQVFEVWAVPLPPAVVRPRLLSFFRTAAATDTTPPTRPAFYGATLERPGAVAADCGPYAAIGLVGEGSRDGGDLLYAVWAADDSGHIAWEAPPIAVAPPAPGSRVRFDVYDALKLASEVTAWARSPKLHVGVRAMDVAGNLSAPLELDVR